MMKSSDLLARLILGFSMMLVAATPTYAADQGDNESFVRPKEIPYLDQNPYSVEKEELGKKLFFDPRLSSSGWISCATCHNPSLGWEDGLPKGLGHGFGRLGRHTPTVMNLAWAELLFWDGRAEYLEGQALGPIESGAEMNMPLADLEKKMRTIKGYRPIFAKAFPKDKEPITKENIAKALAIFQRGVVSGEAPFDRWLKGDKGAMSKRAANGFEIFKGKAQCVACHSGWAFTDYGFHDIGIDDADTGRFEHLKMEKMNHAFKTPTLRDVARRPPYFHNGQAATLAEVVEFYNKGGEAKRATKAGQVTQLKLSKTEKEDLVLFLEALTGDEKPMAIPALPN